jgi:hypothetical protein
MEVLVPGSCMIFNDTKYQAFDQHFYCASLSLIRNPFRTFYPLGSNKEATGSNGLFSSVLTAYSLFLLPVNSLLAVTRLFRIILDVTSPDFHVEGRQWRSSIIDVFYHFFRAMWADERVCHLWPCDIL